MALEMGVLIPLSRYQRLVSGEMEPLRLSALEQEKTYGVRSLFTSPTRVSGGVRAAIMAIATASGFKEQIVEPIPRIYCNLLARPKDIESRAIRELNGNPDALLFNETNRLRIKMVYDILSSRFETRTLVPRYGVASGLPDSPGTYLIVPSRGPAGEGLLLQPAGSKTLRCTDLKDGTQRVVDRNQALVQEDGRPLSPRSIYLSIDNPPVGPNGLPADWRIYVYRTDDTGQFTVGARVAKLDILRTGLERERCWRLDKALTMTFGSGQKSLLAQLDANALLAVRALALYLPGIAHAALDFWIDAQSKMTLVDIAGCYRTDWLLRAGEVQADKKLADHPARFARLLSRTGVAKLHVDFDRTGGQKRA